MCVPSHSTLAEKPNLTDTLLSTDNLRISALWVLWCILHSVLICTTVTTFLQSRLSSRYRYYRLFYNLFSVATLAPLLLYSQLHRGEVVFHWQGWLGVVQALLYASAGLLFLSGARAYDLPTFLGVRLRATGSGDLGLTVSGGLSAVGVLALVRHPWYTGGLLLIWARTQTLTETLINSILSAYIVIGALLEERKLVKEFGADYQAYQRQVSMLVPWKWLKRRISPAG